MAGGLGNSGRTGIREEQLAMFGCRRKQFANTVFHEGGGDFVADYVGMTQKVAQETGVGGHALDAEFTQRAISFCHRVGVSGRRAVDDQLGEQGVEAGDRRVAGIAEMIDADTAASGGFEHAQLATGGLGLASFGHRFHVNAQLDGMAVRHRNLFLGQPQRCQRRTAGDTQLRDDEVDARDFLGNRVFHLQAGIALDEDEVFAADQKFKGTETQIAQFTRHLHRRIQDTEA